MHNLVVENNAEKHVRVEEQSTAVSLAMYPRLTMLNSINIASDAVVVRVCVCGLAR